MSLLKSILSLAIKAPIGVAADAATLMGVLPEVGRKYTQEALRQAVDELQYEDEEL